MSKKENPEKITLPKSGLVLTKSYTGALVAPGSDIRLAQSLISALCGEDGK